MVNILGGMRGEPVSKRYLHPFIRGIAGVDDEENKTGITKGITELSAEVGLL